MDLRDAEVQLSVQRLRELMLWHGKDEGNLPPPESLAYLSRDTVAAIVQLQRTRTQLAEMRESLAQLFWNCESSEIRAALLTALGAPPETASVTQALPPIAWEASPNGLPLPSRARAQRAAASPELSVAG
jgi:hypothetical protein